MILLFLCAGILPAHAWNNDYQGVNTYDNYSQSWQNYKQQNNINTQPAYQQSWWNSAINSIGNFFSNATQAVTNFVNNAGNFFTSVYNNVHDFFIKIPEIKANLATAPPSIETKDATPDAGVINHAPTLDSSSSLSVPPNASAGGTYRNEHNQSAKDNPYAYLTAEKACYDPRAAGLSQFSSQYQAIEAEYAARDKWVASQQTQPNDEGKLADTKPAEVLDSTKPLQGVDQPQQLNQKDISVIAPVQITHPDPSIMPAESWDRVKQTLPQNSAEPKQTIAGQAKAFVSDTAQNIQEDWGENHNVLDTFGKGTLEGAFHDVNTANSKNPFQQFGQSMSEAYRPMAGQAMHGLDYLYKSAGAERGAYKYFLQGSAKVLQGCVVASVIANETVADVLKLGSELPKIQENINKGNGAYARGDYFGALRSYAQALGGVSREAGRITLIKGLFQGVQEVGSPLSAQKALIQGADFYVTPQGVSIPATGYRYISAASPQLSSIINDGIVPANPEGTYITFDKIDNFADVAGRLQIKHDGAIRVEFDTRQILDDIKVPYENRNAGTELEPLTKSMSTLGDGGATQAITYKPIRINRIVDTRTGEVVNEFN